MANAPQENIIMKLGNSVAQWNTNTNAATPLLFFLIVAGVLCLAGSITWLLVAVIIVVGFALIYAFVFQDDKLRDSKHSLALRKLDKMGHKGEENIVEGEVVQPILQPPRQSTVAAKGKH